MANANLVIRIPFVDAVTARNAARNIRTHTLEVEDLLDAEEYTISVEDNSNKAA